MKEKVLVTVRCGIDNKVTVIRCLRTMTGGGLKECKDFADKHFFEPGSSRGNGLPVTILLSMQEFGALVAFNAADVYAFAVDDIRYFDQPQYVRLPGGAYL